MIEVEYIYVYEYIWILFSHKKNNILPTATAWMDPEGIMLSELNQTKTNTFDLTYGINQSTNQSKLTNMKDWWYPGGRERE